MPSQSAGVLSVPCSLLHGNAFFEVVALQLSRHELQWSVCHCKPQGLGVLLILREEMLYLLPDVHFTSHTAFGWAAGLGGCVCVVAFYGLLSVMPFCDVRNGVKIPHAAGFPTPAQAVHSLLVVADHLLPQFEGVNHRKLYGLVSGALAVLLLLAAAITASSVGDTRALTAELRYGWHAAYTGKSPATGISKAQGKVLIRAAQRDLACCGFGHVSKEQAVTPCGPAAQFGCEAPLVEELQVSLLWLAGLEAGGALAAMFALAVVACNAEAARDAMNRGEAPGGGRGGHRSVRYRHRAVPLAAVLQWLRGDSDLRCRHASRARPVCFRAICRQNAPTTPTR